jgi:hypothetical protein
LWPFHDKLLLPWGKEFHTSGYCIALLALQSTHNFLNDIIACNNSFLVVGLQETKLCPSISSLSQVWTCSHWTFSCLICSFKAKSWLVLSLATPSSFEHLQLIFHLQMTFLQDFKGWIRLCLP